MIKSILKGIGITIGIFIAFALISKITLLGFGGGIREMLIQFGELFTNFGESLIRIATK